MKNLFLIAMLGLFMTSFTLAHPGHDGDKKVYTINTEKSMVTWTGKKVTGEHTGNISIKSGQILSHDGSLQSASVTMDMTSITCTDLEDEGYNQKLIGHLSSDDFFSIESHPEASFETTSLKGEGSDYIVTGKLTIKGQTSEISFPVKADMQADGSMSVNGTATFDRTKWNIQYGSGKFFDSLGDKMIYDDVTLEFSLVAIAE
jgi:polyisoprenoid-binding protein YceI